PRSLKMPFIPNGPWLTRPARLGDGWCGPHLQFTRDGDNRGVEELPAGTVTMLFSDIEGSTALLSRLGDRYGEALSDHRAVMRAAIGAWHGHEMGTEGDSFFVVFESAGDAVGCCLAAQRTLAGH